MDINPLAIKLRARAWHMINVHNKPHVMWVPQRADAQLRGKPVHGYVTFTGCGTVAAYTIRELVERVRIAKLWGDLHG